MNEALKEFCYSTYEKSYTDQCDKLECEKHVAKDKIEIVAQKEAIKNTIITAMDSFKEVEAAMIWKTIYEIHIHRKSGIDDSNTISKVISADQSWKKSSGHAFEEMVKFLGNNALNDSGIEIILQKDLNTLIKANELNNEPRDISWLKEQIKASIFDLYAIIKKDNKRFCYGCIQSKTSIRDRVTRDREPSIAAMQSFFWSTIVVLDGDFLKLPKFISMVNGNTVEHPQNGWHGLYVFSDKYTADRIYPTDLDLSNFKEHAIQAANYWLTQRQWFNNTWRAS